MAVTEQPSKRRSERKDFFRYLSGSCQNTQFYATVQNLSTGGICFETDFLFKTGQHLKLTIQPLKQNTPALNLEAEIVWVQPIHMLFHRIGAKLINADPQTQAIVSHYVADAEAARVAPVSGREKYPLLFSPFRLSHLDLKNHLTMAPMFWGYANEDGTVSRRLIDTYEEIAKGGVSMIVVANAVVDPSGIMAARVLRIDNDCFIPGLAKLAKTIKAAGAIACLQINHGGRWAQVEKPYSPSPLHMGTSSDLDALEGIRKEMSKRHQLRLVNRFLSSVMKCRKGMTTDAIIEIQNAFADAAGRVKEAGFDMVELHGATGYLLAQFVSPRSNKRTDAYGGSLENRIRFPLETVGKVKEKVGDDFPIGYRLLADEWLPGGFGIEEARVFSKRLEQSGIAYLSATAGTYESFFLPEIMNRSRQEGYAGDLARQVKEAVPKTPVIVAGRIIGPAPAEKMLRDGHADLVGLARTLFADPLWPHKVEDGEEESILFCKGCNTCLLKVINDEPVVCVRWDKVKTTGLKLALTNKREKWKKILIAMDDTESSLESVEYAGHMIGPGKKITLFSIVNEQQGKDDGRAMREERNVLLAQAKCLLQNAGINEKDIRTKVVKMQKGIEQDLLRELQRGEYGSVILGRRGVSRTRQVLFGSISNYIVHHAKGCGVWVID